MSNTRSSLGNCAVCKKHGIINPLHSERGGPLTCIKCGMEWHAKNGRKRWAGRVAVKAIKAFHDAGGSKEDLDKVCLAAAFAGMNGILGGMLPQLPAGYTDDVVADVPELTTELLKSLLQLVHPDHHPPERRELATQVTKELNALTPFAFPAKPKPVIKPSTPRDTSVNVNLSEAKEPSRPEQSYPCEDCSGNNRFYYCTACKAEWEKREREKNEAANAKQRAWYQARVKRRRFWRKQKCVVCQQSFEKKRRDATTCSAKCRQKSYRLRSKGVAQ